MSLTTAAIQRWHPAAANGVTVTPNGTAWANSTWVQVIAATAEAWVVTHVTCRNPLINAWVEIDVGIGAVGSETVIGTLKAGYVATNNTGQATTLRFPIGLNSVPAGTRVALRIRKSDTSTSAWVMAVGYVRQADIGALEQVTTLVQQVLPAAAVGVNVAAGTSWANGSWVELAASLAEPMAIVGIATRVESANNHAEIDIGIGAAGAEIVLATVPFFIGGVFALRHMSLPFPLNIPAGSRLAVRISTANASGITQGVAVEYFGSLVAETVEFSPDDLAPVGLLWVEAYLPI